MSRQVHACLPVNRLKAALAGGSTQLGLWVSLGSPTAAEIAAGSGFDWLLIDTEHSPNSTKDVLAQVRAIGGCGATPGVRPAANDPVLIKRILDIGVQTLLIPFVESPEEARAAIRATRFAPEGVRGFAGATRANNYGRTAEYARSASEEICVIVQIESRDALDKLEGIAGVDGIDAVFLGAADLSMDIGCFGDVSHPDVRSVIGKTAERLRRLSKPMGILLSREEDIRLALDEGCAFVGVGADTRLLAGASDMLSAKWRSTIDNR